MKAGQFSLLFALFLFLFVACDKPVDPVPPVTGKYSKGIFVVNEGVYGSGTGTITWYDPTTKEVVLDVFGAENNGAALGNVVQSLSFFNGKGYIVVNNGGKVVVVDAGTFKFVGEIAGFKQPRYFMPVSDQVGMVTQWGSNGLTGSLVKVDLAENKILDTLAVGRGPEKMFFLTADHLLVANSGGYETDTTVMAVNWQSMKISDTKKTANANPAAFTWASFGLDRPFVLCQGYWADTTAMGWLGGGTSAYEEGVAFPQTFSNDIATDYSGNYIYFPAGGSIWQYSIGGLKKAFDQAAYGFAIDPTNNLLYCADAGDFQSAGTVTVRSENGNVVHTFQVGVNPGEIVVQR